MFNFTSFAFPNSGPHWQAQDTSFAGISGGRTSGLMAACLDPTIKLLFENTGREHPRTYDFLTALDEALGNRIVWLEYVKPIKKGDAPKNARFQIVNYKTADRTGAPFRAFMETLAEFRETKGLPPVAPWARGRLCTAQMKHKTGERYIKSLGIDVFTMFVGLRADEPTRVHDLKKEESQRVDFRCPLFDVGIKKQDVLDFWSRQSFDLEIQEYQGNCDGCFLKDQSDLSRSLGEMDDPEFWFAMEEYPRFGGADFVGYRQLRDEYEMRLEIEQRLKALYFDGSTTATKQPIDKQVFSTLQNSMLAQQAFKTQKRMLNVIRQEKRRVLHGPVGFSCSCEASFNLPDEV